MFCLYLFPIPLFCISFYSFYFPFAGKALLDHSQRRHRTRHANPHRPPRKRPMSELEQRPNPPPFQQQNGKDRRCRTQKPDHREVLLCRQGLVCQGTSPGRPESRTQKARPIPRQQNRQPQRREVHGSQEGRGRRRRVPQEKQERSLSVTKTGHDNGHVFSFRVFILERVFRRNSVRGSKRLDVIRVVFRQL